MSQYASSTSVSPEKSQEEIKSILRRYQADRFGVMEDRASAAVMFELRGLTVRIVVPLPSPDDKTFRYTPERRVLRSPNQARQAYEQAVRQRWRALLLAIKAKLEAVQAGISTIEHEFMPFVVLPNGQTVGDVLIPQLQEAAKSGRMPQLLALPAPGGAA